MRRALLFLFLLPFALWAQFGPLLSSKQAPQAKSQEELDLYLTIYTQTDPAFRVSAAERFASLYPRSELLGFAYQYQMLAFEDRNDYEGVLRAGEKALALMPRNLHTLITLAGAIPNGVSGRQDAGDLLVRAERYARLALQELRDFKVPQEIPLEEWESQKAEMESKCHEALGHVAMKREDPVTAIRELESAVSVNLKPNGRQYLRLSSAYLLGNRNTEAAAAARRAADLSSGEVRQLALRQLAAIEARKQP
jgi:hypothetical protein